MHDNMSLAVRNLTLTISQRPTMTEFDRMDISSSPPTGRREISEPSPTQYKSEAIVVSSDSGSEDEGWRRKPDLATDEQESHHTDQSLTPTNHRNSPPIPRIYAEQASESMNNYTILEHATSSPRTANPPITILLALTPRPASLRDQIAFDSFGARFSADFSNISVAGKWGCVSLYAHFRDCMKGDKDSEEHRYQEAGHRDDAGGCCASQDSSTNLVPTVRANEDPNTVQFHTTVLNEVEVEMSIHDQDQEPSSGGDVSKMITDLGWAEHPDKSPVKQSAPPQIPSVVREMTTTTKPSPTYDRPEVGIGNIHPTALLAKLDQEIEVHWRLCLPILQELIELEVAKGRRLFVVGGLKMGDIAGIRAFARKVS